MKKLNQNGFGVIEAVLLVVIVGLLAGVGWYVYNQQKEVNQSLDNAQGNLQDLAKQKNNANSNKVDHQTIKTTYSKVPKQLQDVILKSYKKGTPECVNKNGQIIDHNKKPVDLTVLYSKEAGVATTNMSCEGGATGLFASVKEEPWKFIMITQSGFSCEVIRQYNIPESLLKIELSQDKVTCETKDGKTKNYYPDLYY